MVMNGSRSGLLPDPDTFFFGISNDGCIQDLPEPQGPAGPSAMTALYFGNGIIGSQGDPGRQLDPCHLCSGLFLSLFVGHRNKGVIASWHLDVLPSMRQFRLAHSRRACQVGKTRLSGGGAGRRAKRSEASGSERSVGKMPAVRRSRAWKRKRRRCGPRLWPHGRCSAGRSPAARRNKRSFQAGRLLNRRVNENGRAKRRGLAAAEPERVCVV